MVYYINGNRMKRLLSVLLSPKDASDRQSLPQFKPKVINPTMLNLATRGKQVLCCACFIFLPEKTKDASESRKRPFLMPF